MYSIDWKAIVSINWTAMASIASIISVIIAIVFFIIESRRSMFTKAIDILMQYDNQFNSPEFRAKRRRAAEFLLSGCKEEDKNGRQAINDVLNFFETIAFLYNKKVIEAEMVWHTFSSWFLPYWKAAEPYIKESRLHDSTSYEDSDILFADVGAIEKKRCFKYTNKSMSEEESLKSFLKFEAELPYN